MDIKDLIGLSQPLTKLFEVASSGVGRLSRAHFAKKDAEAKAYEIRQIAQAVSDSRHLLGDATLSTGDLTVSIKSESVNQDVPASLPPPPPLAERSLARTSYQEAKKQLNIESVTQQAAEELRNEKTVSDEKVDEDWISRFFSIAENISTDEMQTLWGKILAGEVKRPGSYSLRTLDTLKNLTKTEAEVFVKVAQASVTAEGSSFIFSQENHDRFLEEEFNIKFLDVFLLRELGLMATTHVQMSLKTTGEKEVTTAMVYGSKVVLVKRKPNTPAIVINADTFTQIGKQLLSLVEITPNEKYIHFIAQLLKPQGEGVQMFYADITSHDKTVIHYSNPPIEL